MKVNTLARKPFDIKALYENIKEANERGEFKVFIPHWVHVPEYVKLELIENGYKVHVGDWCGEMINCLIIEW